MEYLGFPSDYLREVKVNREQTKSATNLSLIAEESKTPKHVLDSIREEKMLVQMIVVEVWLASKIVNLV